jgi:isoquinoline 1-oxidoreductase alpha subunit
MKRKGGGHYMAGITLRVNGEEHTVDVDGTVPLQYVLRDDLGLTGTKFGCGMSECGACTVHVDGSPVRSCITQVSSVAGKDVITIEGLAQNDTLHPVQEAWIEAQAPQCGYCQSGQIMEAVALLKSNPQPTEAQIREAMAGHICRCGTYNRIVKAIQIAAQKG